MANTKSASKRIEIGERNRVRNKAYKSTVKTLLKKTLIAIDNIESTTSDAVKKLMSISYSKIDKAIQKGVIHSNTGNSKKALLAKSLKNATKLS
jgi:small subunit ribosomal protein S20